MMKPSSEELSFARVQQAAAPKLSVCMITYNHEKYIAQAIESVLMQNTVFPIELVIGEDCSTDDTRRIICEYQSKYSDIIRPILHKSNVGAHTNFLAALAACRGEYIALLEGDDYWTYPHKLQTQVDFLDAHPEHSCMGHNVLMRWEAEPDKIDYISPPDLKSEIQLEDLFMGNLTHTCSLVLRQANVQSFPDWFTTLAIGDWSLALLNAQIGSIAYIKDVWATYRVHETNNWMGITHIKRMHGMIQALHAYKAHFGPQYAWHVDRSLRECYHTLAAEHLALGQYKEARRYLIKFLKFSTLKEIAGSKRWYARRFAEVAVPSLYRMFQHAKTGRLHVSS